jgi:hypothetical protein
LPVVEVSFATATLEVMVTVDPITMQERFDPGNRSDVD